MRRGHSACGESNSAFAPFSRFCEREASSLPHQVTPSSALTKSQKSSQNPRIAGDSKSTASESHTISESSLKNSKEASESPHSESCSTSESTLSDSHSVIASVAKQSIKQDSEKIDCHAGKPARNDRKTETCPLQNLESTQDSEPTPAERYALSAVKSSFSSEQGSEQALKASSGRGDCQGGRERLRNSSPSPLDEKKTKTNEVNQILEVKTADSKAIDSESKIRAESAMVGYSEQRGLESEKLESAIDSESRNLASRDTSPTAQYDNNSDSKSVDCHADKLACNDKHTKSQANFQKINSRALPKLKARNTSRLESKSQTKSAITKDSKKPQVPKSHTPKHAPRLLTPRLAFHALHYSKCAHIHHKALAC